MKFCKVDLFISTGSREEKDGRIARKLKCHAVDYKWKAKDTINYYYTAPVLDDANFYMSVLEDV